MNTKRATLLMAVLASVVGVPTGRAGGPADREAVRAAVWRIAAREGVDPRLADAVAQTESAYDAWAVSPKGALGVMQLMPRTAGSLGVRNWQNVEENVTAGVRYLRYLQGYYRGDLRLALAAYSAGQGAVAKYRGVPPYMETREYVTAVLERYYGVRRRSSPPAVRGKQRTLLLAGGPGVCGGSEMAYDNSGRLYVRARAAKSGCVGARER
jgi:soluble lytic murein transglycosylase-like protein